MNSNPNNKRNPGNNKSISDSCAYNPKKTKQLTTIENMGYRAGWCTVSVIMPVMIVLSSTVITA